MNDADSHILYCPGRRAMQEHSAASATFYAMGRHPGSWVHYAVTLPYMAGSPVAVSR
jgi:hypothetical protein